MFCCFCVGFFFFKQKTAYEISACLVGSEMCIRDRFTFLEHYDWRGKRIAPFCTNEGSGLGVSERDIKNICKGAEIEKGLSIHGAEAADSRNKVEVWLEELNI